MGIEDRKKREKEQRRNTIIDAALEVFLKKDVSGTTMEEIADKAELSKATLYLYFKNKEELLLNVEVIVLGKFVDLLEAGLATESEPMERLRSVGRSYLKFYSNYHNYFRLMNNFDQPQDFDYSAYELRKDLIAGNARIWELVCCPIKEGMETGIFKADTNALEVGITLWTASTGVMNLWDYMKNTTHPHNKPAETPDDCSHHPMMNIDFERILYNLWDAVFNSILVNKQQT